MGSFSYSDSQRNIGKYTASTIGIIEGVTTFAYNNYHLPFVKYKVNGVQYKTKIPLELAQKMEQTCSAKEKLVRAHLSITSFQLTKLQGLNVKVLYDPNNPKDAIIVE